jgi:hypothetical protein
VENDIDQAKKNQLKELIYNSLGVISSLKHSEIHLTENK